jgi:hypothetical protein
MNATTYSVLTPSTPLPPSSSVNSSITPELQPVFDIARNIITGRRASNGNITGPQPLIQDGSAADPASIGVAVLLANWTGQDGGDYSGAAKDQLDFLQTRVPMTSDGAISHRVAEVQLWYVDSHQVIFIHVSDLHTLTRFPMLLVSYELRCLLE